MLSSEVVCDRKNLPWRICPGEDQSFLDSGFQSEYLSPTHSPETERAVTVSVERSPICLVSLPFCESAGFRLTCFREVHNAFQGRCRVLVQQFWLCVVFLYPRFWAPHSRAR